MSDIVARLNAALEGRYAIERQLGEGGMATVYRRPIRPPVVISPTIDIRTTPPVISKLPPRLQGEAMGHNFVDRLTAEEEGKILPVAQVVDQIAVERAARLSTLAGGVRRDGPVQIR